MAEIVEEPPAKRPALGNGVTEEETTVSDVLPVAGLTADDSTWASRDLLLIELNVSNDVRANQGFMKRWMLYRAVHAYFDGGGTFPTIDVIH